MTTTSVLVLGLGRSGQAVAEYCAARPERFGPITVIDGGDSDALQDVAKRLRSLSVETLLGCDVAEGSWDLCVASPGIPPHASVMLAARDAAAEVISEIEFAFRESKHRWVAITGTNGKTTTTALVAHLLCCAGIDAVAVGNIGAAAIAAVRQQPVSTVLVAEVSSFQLALTDRFHPSVAVLLNITPDHTDWHGSFERYASDKARVFSNLGHADTAVIDIDDPGSAVYVAAVKEMGAHVVRVSVRAPDGADARVDEGELVLGSPDYDMRLLGADELKIKGPHNLSNALAAAAAARALGAGTEALIKGLATFEPIEHRLEPAGVVAGVEWFNDSKATNPDAVFKAIDAFGERPIILLLGGQNKGNDFHDLARAAMARAKAVVVFGQASAELAQAFADVGASAVAVAGMGDAVDAAARLASAGDAVVLSPACASFDEFKNYEHRGCEFKRMVSDMAGAS